MQDGLYVIAGETFDGDDVVAGWRLFRKLKKKFGKIRNVMQQGLKVAAPALGVASMAMPALAPAAAAAAMASRLADSAKRGAKPARAAMRMFGRSAERGDPDSQRFMNVLQRVHHAAPKTLLNAPQMRELALRARQGNPQARRILIYVAGLADSGDPSAQALIEQAAGTARWDMVSGLSLNRDLEIMGAGCAGACTVPAQTTMGMPEIVSGGAIWDYLKPRRGYRSDSEAWGPRDAYRLGIETAPLR